MMHALRSCFELVFAAGIGIFVSYRATLPLLYNVTNCYTHENHFDGFLLAHTQSPEIIRFDIICYYLSGLLFLPHQNSLDIRGYPDTPFISC